MSVILERAFLNLPRFFVYRGIKVEKIPTVDEFKKSVYDHDAKYSRITGHYMVDGKPAKQVHIIFLSKHSTAMKDAPTLKKLLNQSGNNDILVFHEGSTGKTAKNYSNKHSDRNISFYPISVLLLVHPEISHAPKYERVDAKQVEEELNMPITSLKSTITKNDPPMVWFNWPVGSIVKITSHSDYTGTRVGYRKLVD